MKRNPVKPEMENDIYFFKTGPYNRNSNNGAKLLSYVLDHMSKHMAQ